METRWIIIGCWKWNRSEDGIHDTICKGSKWFLMANYMGDRRRDAIAQFEAYTFNIASRPMFSWRNMRRRGLVRCVQIDTASIVENIVRHYNL